MKIVLSVLGGLYTIITETFLLEFMSDLSIYIYIIHKYQYHHHSNHLYHYHKGYVPC